MYNRATKKVVVDAGHGGNDPGALSGSLKEKDLNLKAAQYMYKRLQELGIPTTIVRNTDETLDRKERVQRILLTQEQTPDSDGAACKLHRTPGRGRPQRGGRRLQSGHRRAVRSCLHHQNEQDGRPPY